MLLSAGYSTPTNIPATTAAKLFDLNNDWALVNMDPLPTDTWTNASMGNQTAVTFLSSYFALKVEQIERIGAWFPKFKQSYIYPFLQSQFIDPATQVIFLGFFFTF